MREKWVFRAFHGDISASGGLRRDRATLRTPSYFRSQEEGGFSKGGFCRVQCHDQGDKKPNDIGPSSTCGTQSATAKRGVHFAKPPLKTPFSWFLNIALTGSGSAEGSRNPWVIKFHGRIGMLICHLVTSRPLVFLQKEAVLSPCNFATTHLTAFILKFYLPWTSRPMKWSTISQRPIGVIFCEFFRHLRSLKNYQYSTEGPELSRKFSTSTGNDFWESSGIF